MRSPTPRYRQTLHHGRLRRSSPVLLLIAVGAALALVAAHAENGPAATPFSARAVGFAESLAVRDLPAAPEIDRKAATIPKESKEVNQRNRKVIRQIDPTVTPSPDRALYSQRRAVAPSAGGPPNAPTVTFEGISIADTVAIGQGFLPPDTNGEVGPNHYVQSVNSAFRIWNKAGVPVTATAALSSLFGPLGGACGSSNDGDPIVLYDQLADRWLISQFCRVANPNTHQLIAISKTGDPAGAYYLYDFTMPNSKFNDYPHFGMWPDGYYMTDNQFDPGFLGGGRFAFDRAKMLVGDPTASYIYFDSCPTNIGCAIGGELPSDLDGLTPPPVGAANTFAHFTANEFGDPGDAVRLFDFHADFAVPANSTFTERTGSPLAVAAFDPVIVPDSRNVISQPSPATAESFLDPIADRLMFRLAYRNFGTSESLIANHTVNAATNPLYRAAVRFYQLSRPTPASAFGVTEQETFDGGDSEHRWMGSGAMNFQGDIAVGYSVSSSSVFPSIRYAAHLASDTPGSGLAQGEQTIIAGGGSQTHTSGRWGDYSDLTVDPTDDCSFWFTQEYYPAGGTGSAPWHTRIAKFAPGACATSPRGTISGTITNCTTALPIANAIVQITGGYSRSTIANGTYGAVVPPGTYNASVTGTGYDSASVVGLVVANGGAATFNACLNGTLKQPVADTAAVTADSCNSNSVLDPNELVTVSFGIKNTGTLDTATLVATLQASGGVTNPSAPQPYGTVVAGGATVNQSFTFTTANVACGATVVATLALQDGSTNLGTTSYNLATGVIVANNYSTGNIAVPILDVASVDVPLAVPDIMTLADVNASFRLNHTFDGDLEIRLVHPDNTSVLLVDNRGGTGENFGTGANNCSGTPTRIDSQASTAISAGGAPFAGSFLPESTLGVLNGKPANGSWKLRVTDTAAVDVGTVGCFQLELNRQVVCCAAPFAFHTLPPCRVLDTRNAAGPLGGPALIANVDRTFTIAGSCNVPVTAKAVSFNMTVVAPSVAGNLILHAGGTTVPLASSISYNAAQTRANNGALMLNLVGEVGVFCQQASGTVHFVLDVNGYFE